MPDALSIGLSALQAQQRAMEVTSHNIANLATPGYSRQSVGLTTQIPEDAKPGQVGRGVRLVSVQRANDALVTEQLRTGATTSGRLDLITQVMQTVEGVFNEPSDTGLSAAVNRVFNAFQDLSNNPESAGVRSTAVGELANFVSTVNAMGQRLEQVRDDLAGDLELLATRINGLTSQIADLNEDIRTETVVGNNPNDLLDRRDQLVLELSSLIDMRVRIDPKTQVALLETGGRLIVDADSAVQMRVGSVAGHVGLVATDTSESLRIRDGRVGALVELTDERLPAILDQLDGFVQSLVNELNRAHSVGTNGDTPVRAHVGGTVIATSDYTLDLDDPALGLRENGVGIDEAYLPSFTDANGVSQARNLTINLRDDATGIASKYIVRYEPGAGPIPATRSMRDLVDAITTGTGGGFTVYGPQGTGVPIVGLTASAIQVSGGLRLSLEAVPGTSIDFSKALDTRPSAELGNAATWTAGSPTLDLRGRYTGGASYDPTNPWTVQVLSGGTVGAPTATAPVVRFTWYDTVGGGAPVAHTTDVTLDASQVGKSVTVGAGVQAFFGAGTLVTGDSLDMAVDGAPDQSGLLGALGINTLLEGSSAGSLKVSAPILADPARLAVGQTRVAGDNSNVLAMVDVRQARVFDGAKTAGEHIAGMAAGIGAQVDLSKRLGENQGILTQALQNRRDAASGVNIDEEIGALIKQQQAYTAAARIITSMQENIRTLMDLL